ncbi:MAG TPA: methyltransferase domain-containing protein [Blastocatellia bacterium]|nr:methyltransferase domain-containing protein [Blastocatellia bacterium]
MIQHPTAAENTTIADQLGSDRDTNLSPVAKRYRPGMLGSRFILPRASGLKRFYLDRFGVPDVRAQLTATYILEELSGIRFHRLLDVGCGNGMITCLIASQHPACDVVGIDVSPSGVEYARSLASQNGLARTTFESVNVESDTLRGGFDAIISLAVLQFIHDIPALLRRLTTLLCAGGHLLLQVPVTAPSILMKSRRARNRLPDFKEARGAFTEAEIRDLLAASGFDVIRITPVIKGTTLLAKEIFYLALSLHQRAAFALCPALNWITVRDAKHNGSPAGLFVVARKQ